MLVKILSSSGDTSIVGTIARCSTRDISNEGLRVQFEDSVPAGCALDLWVKVEERSGTFLLSGEVKWSSEKSDGGAFLTGIQIDNESSDDIEAWRALIAEVNVEP